MCTEHLRPQPGHCEKEVHGIFSPWYFENSKMKDALPKETITLNIMMLYQNDEIIV